MHSIPKETSWIKAKAFTWSTKQRYSVTFSAFLALISVAWLSAFKPLHDRYKKVHSLEQECRALEHEIHSLQEDSARVQESISSIKPQATTIYELLSYLTHLLESTGIVLESYSTHQPKKRPMYLLKLTATGTFEAFLHFLESLKEEVAVLQLKSLTFTRQHPMRLKAFIELQATPFCLKGTQA